MITITCKKCGKSDQVTEYQATVKKLMRCHACKAEYAKQLRARRNAEGRPIPRSADRARAYDKARSGDPTVRARRAADMARYTRDPLLRQRHEARWKVRRAVTAGRLSRQPCEICGQLNVHGHHDDYTKPLEVRWLCATCHRDWHKHNTPIYARVGGAK